LTFSNLAEAVYLATYKEENTGIFRILTSWFVYDNVVEPA